MPAWRVRDTGIDIAVRVTPRAGRDRFAAGTDAHFAARLAAPPVDGAANTALIALAAATFGVRQSAVRLVAGDTARHKRLAIEGDATALAQIAASLYGAAP